MSAVYVCPLPYCIHSPANRRTHRQRHTLKCENEQIIKRNTTETGWEWDAKEKTNIIWVVHSVYVVCTEPPTDAPLLHSRIHATNFCVFFFILCIHFANSQVHLSRTQRASAHEHRRLATTPYYDMRRQWGPRHRIATSYTYYPFARIFIRILCFPFGPFKYTYRLYSFMYRYARRQRPQPQRVSNYTAHSLNACDCERTVRTVRT